MILSNWSTKTINSLNLQKLSKFCQLYLAPDLTSKRYVFIETVKNL